MMQPDLLQEVKRPPLRYHGGKFRLAPWIISQLPDHDAYVEAFGGGAGVLLRKARSKIEVYNDLDGQVVNLFRCLRDEATAERLARSIALTPFSRDEFELAYLEADDEVESARRFIVRTHMGHGTSSMDPKDSNGFRSCDIRAGKAYAREWSGVPEALCAAARRFQGVTIEHLDFRRLIPKFDDERTLFYLDPPYPEQTRDNGGKGYVHELTGEDHRQLLWLAKGCAGKVAISGYRCALYDSELKGWRRQDKSTSANGQRGAVKRLESLWMNYDACSSVVISDEQSDMIAREPKANACNERQLVARGRERSRS